MDNFIDKLPHLNYNITNIIKIKIKHLQPILKKFNIFNINDYTKILIIGKKYTGKSWLVRDIMFHKKHIPVGIAISQDKNFYKSFIPKIFLYNQYNQSILINFIKRQQSNNNPCSYLIFDDCLYKKYLQDDIYIKEILFNHHHYHTLSLFTVNSLLEINPEFRYNINYIFILREYNKSELKRIYDHYAYIFKSFEIFCSIVDCYTKDFNCLVIDNNIQSECIEAKIYRQSQN